MSSELILVACTANVCRSPLAELLLRCGLEDAPGVRVLSAGTMAHDGGRACPHVVGWRDDEAWTSAAAAHRSRRATPDMLRAAALILVSSLDVRAEVVLMAPEVRGRTYTLREAAHLGEGFDSTAQPSHASAVARYAMHLDRARVVRGAIPGGRGRWGLVRRSGGPDIVDGHGRSRRAHRAALGEVLDAVTAVIGQLGGAPARR